MIARFLVLVAAGLLTRLVPLGPILWDKYLGDAFYAALVCTIMPRIWAVALLMVAIECFQLTEIPAGLLTSDSWALLGGLSGRNCSVLGYVKIFRTTRDGSIPVSDQTRVLGPPSGRYLCLQVTIRKAVECAERVPDERQGCASDFWLRQNI